MGAKTFPDLLALLYDGLLRPEQWQEFLAELYNRLGCEHAAITYHDPENRNPTIRFSIGVSQQERKEWNNQLGRLNLRTPELLRAALQTGSFLSIKSFHELPAIIQNSEYGQWCRRQDLYHSVLAAVPCGSGAACLSFARPKSAKPFPQSAQKLMRQLQPHLRRVFQIHSRNETLRSFFEAAKIALNNIDSGVIAIDQQGRGVPMNESAEKLLKKGDGVSLRRGPISARHPSEASQLERLINSALRTGCGRGSDHGGVLAVHGQDASAPLSMLVTPFCTNSIFLEGQPCAVAFICDAAAKPLSRSTALRSLFGLTPAECRLATRLHEGLELREAAGRLGVTASTARFMLKRIFSKTGTHRQPELMRLMSGLPGDAAAFHSAFPPREIA